MKRLAWVFVVIILVNALSCHAQVSESTMGAKLKDNLLYGIGLQGGLLSGTGLLFRAEFPNRMGVQAVFGIIKTGDNTYWDIGAEYQYRFNSNASSNFYGLIGIGYYYKNSGQPGNDGNELEGPTRFGFGVGYEWFVSSNIVLNTNLAFTFFTGNKTQILPLPQVGLVYYFQ